MKKSYIAWVSKHLGPAAARRYAQILGTSRRYRESLDRLLAELSHKERAQIAREIHAKAGL